MADRTEPIADCPCTVCEKLRREAAHRERMFELIEKGTPEVPAPDFPDPFRVDESRWGELWREQEELRAAQVKLREKFERLRCEMPELPGFLAYPPRAETQGQRRDRERLTGISLQEIQNRVEEAPIPLTQEVPGPTQIGELTKRLIELEVRVEYLSIKIRAIEQGDPDGKIGLARKVEALRLDTQAHVDQLFDELGQLRQSVTKGLNNAADRIEAVERDVRGARDRMDQQGQMIGELRTTKEDRKP